MKFFSYKNKKRGFTLVEMLIVIVIIGILASALIPRLSKARGRANDVARRAHLSNIGTVLVSYQIDKGKYPTGTKCTSDATFEQDLMDAGLSSMPKDPNGGNIVKGFADSAGDGTGCTLGSYGYISVTKYGTPDAGFVLLSNTETEGGSNWMFKPTTDGFTADSSASLITGGTDYSTITDCELNFKKGETFRFPSGTETRCIFENEDQLKYIYKQ